MLEKIVSDLASPPHGHYSHATIHNGVVYTCGLLGNSLDEHQYEQRSVAVQTHQCLDDLSVILKESGSDFSHVLQVTVYVSDIDDWSEINAVWVKRFGDAKPARAVVPATPLRYGSALEIVVIAAVSV